MTDARVTTITVEQWSGGGSSAQASQLVVEQWASLATGAGQAVLSQLVVEQWSNVTKAAQAQTHVWIAT